MIEWDEIIKILYCLYFELNNNLYNHFKSLPSMQQAEIKQVMQLKILQENFGV